MGILEFQTDLFERAWPITTPVDHEVTGETSAVVANRSVESAGSPRKDGGFFSIHLPVTDASVFTDGNVMTYTDAMKACREGKKVSRPHWYGCLVYRNNKVEFESVPKGLGKTYRPSGIEQHATDWVVQ